MTDSDRGKPASRSGTTASLSGATEGTSRLTARSHDPSNSTDAPVVVVALIDLARGSRLWGWSKVVQRAAALNGTPGLRFAKVMGSGHEGGFGLRPSGSIQGLFCVFDNAVAAQGFTAAGGRLQPWRDRAREIFCVKLKPWSSRGSWSGLQLPVTAAAPTAGPVASLTRASIRPGRAAAFWRMQPAAERSLAHAQGVRVACGIGEAPILRQATFSLWDSVQAMDAYARSGAHQEAIMAAARGRFFSESMFVRFVPYDIEGSWKGQAAERMHAVTADPS